MRALLDGGGGPPLHPSADDARAQLRHELLHPEYHTQNVVQEILRWLGRKVSGGLDRASHAPPLSTVMAMVVFVALAVALGWLASRARRTARTPAEERAVLTEEHVSADQLRTRAEAALAAERYQEAVVEGFRALTLRQIERGRLADSPGATAREVATSLALEYAASADRVTASASVFEAVLYGDHPATHEQARAVLALDDVLVVRR